MTIQCVSEEDPIDFLQIGKAMGRIMGGGDCNMGDHRVVVRVEAFSQNVPTNDSMSHLVGGRRDVNPRRSTHVRDERGGASHMN